MNSLARHSPKSRSPVFRTELVRCSSSVVTARKTRWIESPRSPGKVFWQETVRQAGRSKIACPSSCASVPRSSPSLSRVRFSCEGHAFHGIRKMDPHTPRGGRDHAERLLPPPGYLTRLLVTDRTRDGEAAEGRADRESGAGFGVVARSGIHPGPPFPARYAAGHRHRSACIPNVQAKRGRQSMYLLL